MASIDRTEEKDAISTRSYIHESGPNQSKNQTHQHIPSPPTSPSHTQSDNTQSHTPTVPAQVLDQPHRLQASMVQAQKEVGSGACRSRSRVSLVSGLGLLVVLELRGKGSMMGRLKTFVGEIGVRVRTGVGVGWWFTCQTRERKW